MTHSLLVKAEALTDMTEAFNWYEQKRAGLGDEFLNEVEQFLDRISNHPGQFPSNQDQRIAVLKRFPYKIIFEVEKQTIVVYAVYHDKRNPEKLSER